MNKKVSAIFVLQPLDECADMSAAHLCLQPFLLQASDLFLEKTLIKQKVMSARSLKSESLNGKASDIQNINKINGLECLKPCPQTPYRIRVLHHVCTRILARVQA